MRWYLESPKTNEFIQIEFDEGNVKKTRGKIGDSGTTEAFEYDDLEAAVAAVRVGLEPVWEDGFVDSKHPDDRYKPVPKIAEWFKNDFFNELKSGNAEDREEPLSMKADLEKIYGRTFDHELGFYLDQRDKHAFGYTNYGEWRIWDHDVFIPDDDSNKFEQLILMDQQNYLGTCLFQYLCTMIYLGSAGNGDTYFAHPNDSDDGQAEVIFFDHEVGRPEFAFADSVATLAWSNHLYERVSNGEFDVEQLQEDATLIEERANFSWHYESVSDESEVWPEYEKKSNGMYYFYRVHWLIYLFRNDGVVKVDDCGEMFYTDIHAAQVFENVVKMPFHMKNNPITSFYWLWRSWWFNKTDDLQTCFDLVAEHPSPMVHDAVALIKELEAGRKTVGKIEDIHALRDAWIALDLDPARAEEKLAEEAAAQLKAEEELPANLQKAIAICADQDVEGVKNAAWDYIGSGEVLDVLYEHAEQEDPSLSLPLARHRFLVNNGSSRDGKGFTFEDEETMLALGETGADILPLLLTHHRPGVALATKADAAFERLRPKWDERDEYFHNLTSTLKGSMNFDLSGEVDTLIAMLDELNYDGDDFMTGISNKQVVKALCDALGATGEEAAIEPLWMFVCNSGNSDVIPRAIRALGELKSANVVPLLEQMLGSEFSQVALYAIARNGHPSPGFDAYVNQIAGEPNRTIFERVAQHALTATLTGNVDEKLLNEAIHIVINKTFVDAEMRVLVVGSFDNDYVHRLFVDDPHPEVRAIVHQKLGITPNYYDRPTAEYLFKKEGVDGLRTAFNDPDGVFKHNLVRVAVDNEVATELEKEILYYADHITRFESYTGGYISDDYTNITYSLAAIASVNHPAFDTFLSCLVRHPSALYRGFDAFKYDRDGLKLRLAAYYDDANLWESFVTSRGLDLPDEPTSSPIAAFGRNPWGFGCQVNGMAWHPDGNMLVVGGAGKVVAFKPNGDVQHQFTEFNGGHIYDITFNSDGSKFAVAAHSGHYALVDSSTNKVTMLSAQRGGIRKVRFSPNDAMIATVSDNQTLVVTNVDDLEIVFAHEDTADVNTVAWVDDKRLVIATDRAAKLIDISSGEIVAEENTGGVAEVQVQGKKVYVGTPSGIRVFNSKTLKEHPKLTIEQDNVARIRFSHDGKRMFTAIWGGDSQGLSVWNLKGKTQTPLPGHDEKPIYAMDIHPKSDAISAGGDLFKIVNWDADGDLVPLDVAFHTNEISEFLFLNDSLMTASDDGQVIEWTTTADAIRVFETGFRCCDVLVSKNGEVVFVCGSSSVVALDRKTGATLWSTELGRAERMADTATHLVVASYNTLAWVDKKTGEISTVTDEFADSFMFHRLRIDNSNVGFAGYDDNELFVWNLNEQTLKNRYTLPATAGSKIRGTAKSDTEVFISTWDEAVVIFDLETREVKKIIRCRYSLDNLTVDPKTGGVMGTAGSTVYRFNVDGSVRDSIDVKAAISCASVDGGVLFVGLNTGGVRVVRL